MKQKITIKTIAKELGVSTSTVSKALKDIETLKDKVRQNGNSYSSNNVPG